MTGDVGLDYEVHGTTAEVTVNGDLDMATTFKLEPAIERVVAQNSVDELVLDLRGVAFMDSSGLGLLLSTQQRLDDRGITTRIRRPSPAVKRVIDASGMHGLLIG